MDIILTIILGYFVIIALFALFNYCMELLATIAVLGVLLTGVYGVGFITKEFFEFVSDSPLFR